ncbi:MAG: nucleotidyltransferase family protein [Flavobacteriales bacterium]
MKHRNNHKMKLAVVILAAGESKRMGKPKQLLPWGNSTLLGHSISTVLEIQKEHVYVVLGAFYDEIIDKHQNFPVQVLKNESWKDGMSSSITLAIQTIENQNIDGVLFLLADQPEVDSTYIQSIIKDFNEHQDLITTKYPKSIGIPVIFGRSYFSELKNINTQSGAKSVIMENLTNIKVKTPKHFFRDIDTPEVYRVLKWELGG